MARDNESIWYRLGWVMEEVMATLPPRTGGRRSPGGGSSRKEEEGSAVPGPLPTLLLGVGSTLLTTLLARWAAKRRLPLRHITRGALAGAGAAAAILALRILLENGEERRGETLEEVRDELLSGAGKGVLYAAFLDPYLPGPPLLRGAMAGSVDFLATPVGGLFAFLQPLSPMRRLPFLGNLLLGTGKVEKDPYLTFLVHGTILGILYGTPMSNDRG